MSNLTTSRNTPKMQISTVEFAFPVKASALLVAGCFAMLSAGFAANPSASTALFGLGRVKKTVDNSAGSDGDLTVTVETGAFRWDNGDSIAQADLPCPVFFGDNHTVYKAQGTKSYGGVAIKVDAVGVWVVTDPAMVTAAASISQSLSSTANGKGASLVALEDAAGNTTATDVEAALAELYGFNKVKVQKVEATLVAGTVTVSTGIVVTASTRVVSINPTVRGGTFPDGGFQSLTAGNVVGAAGTGAVTITARAQDGSLQNACTDTVCALLIG